MARRKKSSDKTDFGDYSMVHITFNDREKKEIADHYGSTTVDFSETMRDLGETGFKFSISFSDGWDNWVVSITNKSVKDIQKNAVYLIRHADYDRVLQIADYFLRVMYENGDDRLKTEEEDYNW